METEAGTCAVHSMTIENIKNLQTDVKTIQTDIITIKTTVATIQERIDWVKAIAWLAFASLVAGIVNIILSATK